MDVTMSRFHNETLNCLSRMKGNFHVRFLGGKAAARRRPTRLKELKSHFSEKKALALLYKLEKATIELVETGRKIVELSEEFRGKWLQK